MRFSVNNKVHNSRVAQYNMSSVVYLGQTPASSQVVSADLTSRGINLVRVSPSEVILRGVRDYDHPSYKLYTQSLAAAFDSAINDKVVPIKKEYKYYYYDQKQVPKCVEDP